MQIEHADINIFIFTGIEYYSVINIFRDKYNVYFGTDNRDFICMEKGWLKLDVMLFITTPTLKLSLIIYDTASLSIFSGPRVLWLVLFMLSNMYYF